MLYVQDQEGMAVIVVNWGEMTVSGGGGKWLKYLVMNWHKDKRHRISVCTSRHTQVTRVFAELLQNPHGACMGLIGIPEYTCNQIWPLRRVHIKVEHPELLVLMVVLDGLWEKPRHVRGVRWPASGSPLHNQHTYFHPPHWPLRNSTCIHDFLLPTLPGHYFVIYALLWFNVPCLPNWTY